MDDWGYPVEETFIYMWSCFFLFQSSDWVLLTRFFCFGATR
jgi:hypothetical protein